ncbi:hypothetical protein M0805_008305 [Coniferiporia weirii]|nr:hypothetical protein M0805_008305 [Coniferiporia weirii]
MSASLSYSTPGARVQQSRSANDTGQQEPAPRSVWGRIVHHFKRHVGIGIICAVAYFDPGNWSTDLLAGSQFGYKLLFIVLVAGLGAVVVQALSSKLGCVTGLDLATHCRLLLHDHHKYPRLVRYTFLYPLYALSELAIISTDLAELLGSAIGLVLLFPKLPLPVAVALTAVDVLFILAVGDPSKGHGRAVRSFELIIISLVLVVFVCFIVLIVKVSPSWPTVFDGFLPSKTLGGPSALYASVGIIGATVMPHALYLGSYLATLDRVTTTPLARPLPSPTSSTAPSRRARVKNLIKSLFSAHRSKAGEDGKPDSWTPYGERENNALSFIKAHYTHGLWDIILSLLGFAVVINSAILILAGAVFFYGKGNEMNGDSAGLFDAFNLIETLIGKPAAIVFAVALVCSGQSASITVTLAGQIVSEGFLQWGVSPFFRRLLTRLLGLIPAMIVAIVVGKAGINTLLVISQVVLSIVLPFVMFPLIWLTSSPVVMRVRKTPLSSKLHASTGKQGVNGKGRRKSETSLGDIASDAGDIFAISETKKVDEVAEQDADDYDTKGKSGSADAEHVEMVSDSKEDDEYVDYSNGWVMTVLAYAIWLVVLVANGYVIVTLAIG